MRSVAMTVTFVVLCLGVTFLLTACQSTEKHASHETASVCPMCKTETTTAPIKGLTYTKAVCPSCKNVSTLDPQTAEAVRNYVGGEVGDTVHVCDHCKAVVEKCPVCRAQGGKHGANPAKPS